MTKLTRKTKRVMRHRRVRSKMSGSESMPRLMVFRSNKHLYVQLIDDEKSQVIASSSDIKMKPKKTGMDMAKEIGKVIAGKMKERNIEKIVFDRGGYKYHGQVKVLAEEMRALGITF